LIFNLSIFFVVSGFKQSHTSRAICCRLEKATDPIRVHHPMIGKIRKFGILITHLILGRVKYPIVQPQEFDSDYSYAWSTAFQGEVIDARSGRPVTGYEVKLTIGNFTFLFQAGQVLYQKLCF
jgi:hypothetical protein